jgi:hypothetical protein
MKPQLGPFATSLLSEAPPASWSELTKALSVVPAESIQRAIVVQLESGQPSAEEYRFLTRTVELASKSYCAKAAIEKGYPMKAEEARRISERNLKGPVIEPLLEVAYDRIKAAAERGERSVLYPFYGLSIPSFPTLSTEVKEAAFQRLREEGYTVKHHDNPDPGDPRSSDYDEVSW